MGRINPTVLFPLSEYADEMAQASQSASRWVSPYSLEKLFGNMAQRVLKITGASPQDVVSMLLCPDARKLIEANCLNHHWVWVAVQMMASASWNSRGVCPLDTEMFQAAVQALRRDWMKRYARFGLSLKDYGNINDGILVATDAMLIQVENAGTADATISGRPNPILIDVSSASSTTASTSRDSTQDLDLQQFHDRLEDMSGDSILREFGWTR